AATALSSGYKTRNGVLGQDESGSVRRTILEVARDAGFRTGLVTTTRVTHATPAGFAAHLPDRNAEESVADQYLTADLSVLMGGGAKFFPKERLDAFAARGFAVAACASELRAFAPGVGKRLLGLFRADHMSFEIDRDPSQEPSLREMTVAALDLLAQE